MNVRDAVREEERTGVGEEECTSEYGCRSPRWDSGCEECVREVLKHVGRNGDVGSNFVNN